MKVFNQIVLLASASARNARQLEASGVEKLVQHFTSINTEKLQDYGCAGRGYFDSTEQTVGLPLDEIDRSFIWWKKCIKCARAEYSAFDLEYNHFDYQEFYEYYFESETCGNLVPKFQNI